MQLELQPAKTAVKKNRNTWTEEERLVGQGKDTAKKLYRLNVVPSLLQS